MLKIKTFHIFSTDELELGSAMGSGSGDQPSDLEDDDDDDPSGQIWPKKKHPVFTFPVEPPSPPRRQPEFIPPPFKEDDVGANTNPNTNFVEPWKPIDNSYPIPSIPIAKPDADDFAPLPPQVDREIINFSPTQKPSYNYPTTRKPVDDFNYHNKMPPKVVTTTTTSGNDHASSSDSGKAIAVFKLFTPIIVSMIGKLFTFS